MDASADNDTYPTSAAAIFTLVTHPFLRSVEPVKVSFLLKEREGCELQVVQKQKELPTLTVSPCTASIDRTLLKPMVMLRLFDSVAPDKPTEELTSENMKTFMGSLARKPQSGNDPQYIEKVLKGLRMPMNIADPSARVLHFANCFFERLEQVRYGDFCTDDPEKSTELICQHLLPQKLRDVMTERVEYDKSLKNDVKAFVGMIRNEAVSCQTYSNGKHDDSIISKKGNENRYEAASAKVTNSTEKKDKLPICLYPLHAKKGIRHLLQNCRICADHEKPDLVAKFKTQKAARFNQGAKTVRGGPTKQLHMEISVTFFAAYGQKLQHMLVANIGADDSLTDTALVDRIQKVGGSVHIKDLVRPVVISFAEGAERHGNNINILCKQSATLDVELHGRHRCSLMIRNLKWLVTEQPMTEPFSNRPTLEVLRLDTKDILAAATDRLHGDIDMSTALLVSDSGGKIARVLQEGLYHSDKGIDSASTEANSDWLDFGEDDPSEKYEAVEAMLTRAAKNEISESGLLALRTLTKQFGDALRLRLGPGPPAKVKPMKIDVVENARPIRVKQRRYPHEKRVFMNRFVSKLEEYGVIKKTTNAQWIAAPVIVPKPPPGILSADGRPPWNQLCHQASDLADA